MAGPQAHGLAQIATGDLPWRRTRNPLARRRQIEIAQAAGGEPFRRMASPHPGTQNKEPGTWNSEPFRRMASPHLDTQNTELGTRNSEPFRRMASPHLGTQNKEPGTWNQELLRRSSCLQIASR